MLCQVYVGRQWGCSTQQVCVCRIVNIVIAEPSIGQDEQSSFNPSDGALPLQPAGRLVAVRYSLPSACQS